MWFKRYLAIMVVAAIMVGFWMAIIIQLTTIPEKTEKIETTIETTDTPEEESHEEENTVVNTKDSLLGTRFVYHEKYTKVPNYFQTDYPNTPYGNYGTVASHGCGIASIFLCNHRQKNFNMERSSRSIRKWTGSYCISS